MKHIQFLPWLSLALYLLSFYLPAFKNTETGQKYIGLMIIIPSFVVTSFTITTYVVVAGLANIFFIFALVLPYSIIWAILSVVSSLGAFTVCDIHQNYQYQNIRPSVGLYVWISSFIVILSYQILKTYE
jgi:glucan phosphoethanolaminetransferase (alkaline phosphatase superfamily)